MALSGNIKTTGYDGRYYTLAWTATQSIANNTSTISWTLSCAGGANSWYAERTLTATLAGKTLVSKTDRVERYAGNIASGSFSITHNNAGEFSMSGSVKAAVYTSVVNCSGSGTFTLNQIPRSATLTAAPNFNDEANPKIAYSNPAGNAVATLQAAITNTGGTTAYCKYRDISKTGNAYTFSLTAAERLALRKACTGKSMKVRFNVATTIGGTTYYSYLDKTLSIVNGNPVIVSATAEDTSPMSFPLTGGDYLIKGFNSVAVAVEATGAKSATISSYSIQNGSKVINAASGTFTNCESGVFTIKITDSRGFTTQETIELDMLDYKPVSSDIKVSPLTTDGTLTFQLSGNYWIGYFGLTGNSLTVEYSYGLEGATKNWMTSSSITTDSSTNTYQSSVLYVSGLDYRNTYVIQARAYDKVGAVVYSEEIKTTSIPVFDWGKDDFNFNVPVSFQGDTMADMIVDTGTSDLWTYRKWKSGIAECWGYKDITVNVNTAWGSLYTSGIISAVNVAFPFTFAATPSVMTTLSTTSAGGILMVPGGAGTNQPSATQTGVLEIARGTAITNAVYRVNYYARGMWK